MPTHSFIHTLKNNLKKPKWYISTIVGVLVVGGIAYGAFSAPEVSFSTAPAVKRDLSQLVSVTGRVKPASEVALAFEKSGRVRNINVAVGQKVFAGSVLVALENGELAAQLDQANASVKAQQAKLDQLKRGSTESEIKIQEVKLENARVSLQDANRAAIDALQTAYTNMDDVIHNQTDQFFINIKSASPQFTPFAEPQLKANIELGRLDIEPKLVAWKASLVGVSDTIDFVPLFSTAKQNLASVKSYIDSLAQAINALTPAYNITQATIDSYKAVIQTARATVLAQISAITAADQTVRTAQSTLILERSQLDLVKTPTRPEEILAQEAQVEQAQANSQNIQAQIAKTILRSPIDGVVTAKNIQVGEIVAPNTSVVSVISQSTYKIEANVAESDIANIKVGDKADVTLDAYNDVHFEAKVVSVDPAEVIIEGVPTYKVTLNFISEDARIRSGMTANTDVITAEVKDALVIPARAVSLKDGKRVVKIPDGKGGTTEIEVTVGIKDGEGNIQILSGLNEGDQVVVFVGK